MTSIQWTQNADGSPGKTWNPVRGCSRVSEGCRNCYAERMASRFTRSIDEIPGPRIGQTHDAFHGFAKMTPAGGRWTGKVELIPSALDKPLRWRKPQRIFVNSMSDLFHESLPNESIAAVFGVMAAAPRHTFQILTKRPARMLDWFGWIEAQRPRLSIALVEAGGAWPGSRGQSAQAALCCYHARFALERLGDLPFPLWPFPNVWLGVSVEDQATADERIPLLLQTPAVVRWISAEPLLGPIDLARIRLPADGSLRLCAGGKPPARVDWVVAGGESGPDARPSYPGWFRSLRNQCVAASVPFFFKQWGEWYGGRDRAVWVSENAPVINWPSGEISWRCGKRAAGRVLDGHTHDEYPT